MWHLGVLVTLVATVSALSVKTIDCPRSCECSESPRQPDSVELLYSRLICEAANVSGLILPDNTRVLTLQNVELDFHEAVVEIVESFKLPFLTKLVFVNITSSDVISDVILYCGDLESLRVLVITSSSLTVVPIVNSTQLTSLDLSGNRLVSVPGNTFDCLPQLEELNLSANIIAHIVSASFIGLESLKCLDMSGNNLTDLQDSDFAPLKSLQHLNLSGNRLELLRESCLSSLVYLQQLDVSWNRLVSVTPGSLELPSLARLLLAGNVRLGDHNETTSGGLLVGNGRRLQIVDASSTGLKQVPSALTHSIRTLRLAGNSISAVNCGDLDSYPLLQLLDFTANQLDAIEDDALGRLDSLTILYLRENLLDVIPHSLPVRLKVVHLEQNRIQIVRTLDLLGLLDLEVLLLSDNSISVVEESAFSELGSLETLDLSRNPIRTLGAICGPRALRALRLSHLGVISAARETTFPVSSPEYLINLDLDHSPGLAGQFLADTAALAAARQLQELNIAFSDLHHIRADLLHYLSQLRVLYLDGNPLNCSGLHWLALWMRRQDLQEYRRVVCTSPPDLWGALLVDMQVIETLPEMVTEATTIATTVTQAEEQEEVVNHRVLVTVPEKERRGETNKFNKNATGERLSLPLVLYNKSSNITTAVPPANLSEEKTTATAATAEVITQSGRGDKSTDEDMSHGGWELFPSYDIVPNTTNMVDRNSQENITTKSVKLVTKPDYNNVLKETTVLDNTKPPLSNNHHQLLDDKIVNEHHIKDVDVTAAASTTEGKLPQALVSHPGMLLVLGIVGILAVTSLFVVTVNHRRGGRGKQSSWWRRQSSATDQCSTVPEEIEVASLSSVGDLW